MISPAEVARTAHRLGVGDRTIEKDYVLSWLLVAIAGSDLRDLLAFKGGTALKRCYYPEYRFSEDLDFTLCADMSHEEAITAFENLFPELLSRTNLTIATQSAELSFFQSSTLLLNYVGPLRGRLESRHLKVDITRGELLQYPVTARVLLAPYSDFPSDVALPVYALEEIVVEKLCAIIGRTEPRDLYDVYWLVERGDVDLLFLPDDFVAKAQHKGCDPGRLGEVLTSREAVLDRLWKSRLALQVRELPPLDEVLRVVRRQLRALQLI